MSIKPSLLDDLQVSRAVVHDLVKYGKSTLDPSTATTAVKHLTYCGYTVVREDMQTESWVVTHPNGGHQLTFNFVDPDVVYLTLVSEEQLP